MASGPCSVRRLSVQTIRWPRSPPRPHPAAAGRAARSPRRSGTSRRRRAVDVQVRDDLRDQVDRRRARRRPPQELHEPLVLAGGAATGRVTAVDLERQRRDRVGQNPHARVGVGDRQDVLGRDRLQRLRERQGFAGQRPLSPFVRMSSPRRYERRPNRRSPVRLLPEAPPVPTVGACWRVAGPQPEVETTGRGFTRRSTARRPRARSAFVGKCLPVAEGPHPRGANRPESEYGVSGRDQEPGSLLPAPRGRYCRLADLCSLEARG